MKPIIVAVGLGNPGSKYKKTRHNVGLRVIDVLKREISDKHIILFKPQTYMNQSGKAVKSLITNYGLQITDIVVIHDDIDLPFGAIRVSKNASSAGHKGVQSIIDELKSQDFKRIRIGINPGRKVNTEKYVLEKFTKQEEKQLKEIIKEAVSKLKQLL